VPKKPVKRPPSSGLKSKSAIKRILAIDIGGTGLKAAVIGPTGKFLEERVRVKTPHNCTPKKMVPLLVRLVKDFKSYDRVSIGFPGYVRGGKVFTAPHLGTRAWSGFHLEAAMQRALKTPTRVLNDADVQGLAAITGRGSNWSAPWAPGWAPPCSRMACCCRTWICRIWRSMPRMISTFISATPP
jgi:ROK family